TQVPKAASNKKGRLSPGGWLPPHAQTAESIGLAYLATPPPHIRHCVDNLLRHFHDGTLIARAPWGCQEVLSLPWIASGMMDFVRGAARPEGATSLETARSFVTSCLNSALC